MLTHTHVCARTDNALSHIQSLWRLIHHTFALRCRKKKRDVFILSTTLGQEATVRTGHGTIDQFQIGKGVYCHPAYLTYMQSTSCEMLGGMKHKLESRIARRNINNLRYADDTTLMAENEEELKSLLMKEKEESGKSWFKSQHSEN